MSSTTSKRPRVSRTLSLRINNAVDHWLPPVVRDSRVIAALVRRSYRELPIDINDLKARAFYLSRDEYSNFYQSLQSKVDQGVTDLTPDSLDGVLESVVGESVLDVACGLGYLAERLAAQGRHVTGADVAVRSGRRGTNASVSWCEANIEHLPFRTDAFDTVVSTHTLEHVQHLRETLDELRRVARHRVIVVVPRQRPYRVTFNPHVHFFPYEFSWLAWSGTNRPHTLTLRGGDWLYVEDQA